VEMRNHVAEVIVALLAVLALSSAVMAQERAPRAVPQGYVTAGVPKMPNPPGPAPKHDLTGAWVGPIMTVMGPYPDMTPAGKAVFNLNMPVPEAGRQAPDAPQNVAATNDPFMICDPLGVPLDLLNHANSIGGGRGIQPAGNRQVRWFELPE